MDQMAPLKRKHADEVDNETDQKKAKIDSAEGVCYILQLPECVLFILLSYFDGSSLYALSQTCQLFHEMVKQPRFWRFVDARNAPHDPEKFVYCCKRIHEGTTHFLYKGKSRTVEVLSGRFFSKVRFWSNLKVLALENQYICGNTYLLRFFPQSMEELSLRKTYVKNGFSFFRFSSSLEKLRVLILDHCQWVETSNLVPIANLKRLEILSLYMCKRLSDTDIGYLSLSGDYGLKSLKVLDVRYTAVGNQLLSSMYKSPTLQELYFQCYSTTYQLDRSKRKLAIVRGAKQEPHSYMSDDEENLDINKQRMIKRYGDVSFRTSLTDVVDDGGVAMFKYLQASDIKHERPKSYLFRDPYLECKCGYHKNFWDDKPNDIPPKHDYSSSDSDDDDRKKLKQTIRKRRRQLKAALRTRMAPPMYYVVYSTQSEKNERTTPFEWIDDRGPQNEEEMKMLDHTIVERTIDQGIIICGQHRSQFSYLGESFFMPSLHNLPTAEAGTSERDTSDEEDVASLPETMEEPSPRGELAQNAADPYLRICFRPPDLKARCRLNRLSLRGYPRITDTSLQYLKDIQLELLDVSYTNVTARGVRDFMVVHPDCRVVHESACICGPRMHF